MMVRTVCDAMGSWKAVVIGKLDSPTGTGRTRDQAIDALIALVTSAQEEMVYVEDVPVDFGGGKK
jgi:hypothetical protein